MKQVISYNSLLVLLFFVFCFQSTIASVCSIGVSNSPTEGCFTVVAGGNAAKIIVDPADAEVVGIAAKALAGDIQLLTDVDVQVKNVINDAEVVIVGTLQSDFIKQMIVNGKINANDLENKWETFCISVIDNPLSGVNKALVIVGSDPRGAAFGIFELSRMMGVSPWVWWADVTPAKRTAIYVSQGKSIVGPPSVKYRGMFLNDEDWGFQPWAAKKMDTNIRPDGTGDVGPNTYIKLFELMLRLKSNYIWPAKRPCTKAFWFYPQNYDLAKRYSIVMGSAHNEQMLRDNLDEWTNNFESEYGTPSGDFNWATNSTKIKQYWTDRVKQSKNHEAIYTLGMRAVNDRPMLGYDTDEQRKTALIDIIQNQRTILTSNLNKEISQIPQLFCPYKEVLPVYRLGINLPDDVTLLWVDDNFGFMRQLPNETEQNRSGGSGIYYHYSYNGSPQSYLWIGTTSPAVAVFEMKKAYEMNCRQIWMFNVGDLKPSEYEFSYSMDLAWDINAIDLGSVNSYARKWGAETFGDTFGEDIYNLKKEYFELCSAGKPEMVNKINYSITEIKNRLARFDKLVNDVNSVEARLPEYLKDAYFQLIQYPMEAAAAMNTKILCAKLSFDSGSQGRIDETLDLSDKAMTAYQKIIDLTQKYNKEIAGGKWDGMMNYAPLSSTFFYEPTVYNFQATENAGIPAKPDSIMVIGADEYVAKHAAGQQIIPVEGLGITQKAMTVWPLNLTTYTSENINSAPSLEYQIPVLKGTNNINVLCLPTFPLYNGLQMRYAISIEDSAPVFNNIETNLQGDSNNKWGQNVIQGYAQETTIYISDADKNIKVKIYFPDPGLVVSAIKVVSTAPDMLNELIVNADFEYQSEGVVNDGTTFRGVPYGWNQTGTLIGNSFGINNDASNKSGNNACWFNSTPMPANFELFQTIKNLPAGEYVVRCRMAGFEGLLANLRLFANNNVQYFGSKADYVSNLSANEINTFAGCKVQSANGSLANLQEMAVKVNVFQGDSLKLGVRTSNKKSDGTTATNNTGWFKVDHFRLECVRLFAENNVKAELDSLLEVAIALYDTTRMGNKFNDYPEEARTAFNTAIQDANKVSNNTDTKEIVNEIITLQNAIVKYKASKITATSFIVNPSFEYKSAGVLNDGSIVRGTPYGWTDTGGLSGNSWGINNGAVNLIGTNVCWYMSTPMPNSFELSQTVNGLPAGEYEVSCLLAVMDGKISTQRLFANNNVQYFGKESDYGTNLIQGENATFAGWSTSTNYYLKNMSVAVNLAENESLKIGIRSTNKKSNGQTATDNSGWFKVDYFQITSKSLNAETDVHKIDNTLFRPSIYGSLGGLYICLDGAKSKVTISVYNLMGFMLYSQNSVSNTNFITFKPGLYIVKVNSGEYQKVEKVIVR
jgi:hypothetical protein